ncbi:MAG: hypothetical protein ACTSRG_26695 [Candidatus Helarchaeota archaeon]
MKGLHIEFKFTFVIAFVIIGISLLSILIPSTIINFRFYKPPIFMYFYYLGAIILFIAGIIYLINSIKGNNKILILALVLGILAICILIFANINIISYIELLIDENAYLLSYLFSPIRVFPLGNSYLEIKKFITIFNIFLDFIVLTLMIINFVLTFQRKNLAIENQL